MDLNAPNMFPADDVACPYCGTKYDFEEDMPTDRWEQTQCEACNRPFGIRTHWFIETRQGDAPG